MCLSHPLMLLIRPVNQKIMFMLRRSTGEVCTQMPKSQTIKLFVVLSAVALSEK